MQETDFFQQIEQIKVPWRDQTLLFPVFYEDVTTLSFQFLASLERMKQILPSSRMHPLRITPWHCAINISAFEYRASDIGAYNEVSIGIPIVLDHPAPLFTGTLRPVPAVPQVYIHHLPVTTEIARDAGIEFYGFPKFLADITFERDGQTIRCHLKENGQPILTLTGQNGVLKRVPRSRIHPITVREGYLLRCELVVSGREQVEGRGAAAVGLTLGDHPIAQTLAEWKVGQILGYQYTPRHQVILTPAVESFGV